MSATGEFELSGPETLAVIIGAALIACVPTFVALGLGVNGWFSAALWITVWLVAGELTWLAKRRKFERQKAQRGG